MANAADDSFDDDNNDNLSNSQLSGDSSNRTVRGTFTRNSPQQGSFSFFSSNFGKRNSNYNSENARYHTVGTVEHEDVEGVEPSTEDSTLGSHASSMFRSILGYVSNSFVVGRNDPSIANRQPVHSSLNGSSAYGRNPNNKYNSDIDRSLLESITL